MSVLLTILVARAWRYPMSLLNLSLFRLNFSRLPFLPFILPSVAVDITALAACWPLVTLPTADANGLIWDLPSLALKKNNQFPHFFRYVCILKTIAIGQKGAYVDSWPWRKWKCANLNYLDHFSLEYFGKSKNDSLLLWIVCKKTFVTLEHLYIVVGNPTKSRLVVCWPFSIVRPAGGLAFAPNPPFGTAADQTSDTYVKINVRSGQHPLQSKSVIIWNVIPTFFLGFFPVPSRHTLDPPKSTRIVFQVLLLREFFADL